jgi:hypothetical protein
MPVQYEIAVDARQPMNGQHIAILDSRALWTIALHRLIDCAGCNVWLIATRAE